MQVSPNNVSNIGRDRPRCRRWVGGFTLIEIMAVLIIVTVLVGLLMNGLTKVRRQAEIQKARTSIRRLLTAFEAYRADYATWPYIDGTVHEVDQPMVRLLGGVNETSGGLQGNRKERIYLPFKGSETNSLGFMDPWGRPYLVLFDVGTITDNVTTNPFGPVGASNAVPLLIWSKGPNGLADNGGELSEANRDNIPSN